MMTHTEARRLAVSAAREEAERDLKFSGDQAIRKLGLPADKAAELREALLFYAENGAARGVALLALHGAFVDVKTSGQAAAIVRYLKSPSNENWKAACAAELNPEPYAEPRYEHQD